MGKKEIQVIEHCGGFIVKGCEGCADKCKPTLCSILEDRFKLNKSSKFKCGAYNG